MFTVHEGADRIALVGEASTLKVARADVGKCLDSVQLAWSRGKFLQLQREWTSFSVNQHQSMKYFIFRGIKANRTEARLASQHPDAVIPTMTILGGLANIQPTVEVAEPNNLEVHRLFIDQLGQRAVKLHLDHTLEPEKHNLGWHNGQVKFIDAGSDGLDHLLSTKSAAILSVLGALGEILASNK